MTHRYFTSALVTVALVVTAGASAISARPPQPDGERERNAGRRAAPVVAPAPEKAPDLRAGGIAEVFWLDGDGQKASNLRAIASDQELTARLFDAPAGDPIPSVIVIYDKAGNARICIGSAEACKELMEGDPEENELTGTDVTW